MEFKSCLHCSYCIFSDDGRWYSEKFLCRHPQNISFISQFNENGFFLPIRCCDRDRSYCGFDGKLWTEGAFTIEGKQDIPDIVSTQFGEVRFSMEYFEKSLKNLEPVDRLNNVDKFLLDIMKIYEKESEHGLSQLFYDLHKKIEEKVNEL
jgi:hypothetical protein